MKKPKLGKYPKRPKTNASPDVKLNWVKRCEDVDKKNRDKMKPYKDYISKQTKANAAMKKVGKPSDKV